MPFTQHLHVMTLRFLRKMGWSIRQGRGFCLHRLRRLSHSILREALERVHEPLRTLAGQTGLLSQGAGLKCAVCQARGERSSREVVAAGPGLMAELPMQRTPLGGLFCCQLAGRPAFQKAPQDTGTYLDSRPTSGQDSKHTKTSAPGSLTLCTLLGFSNHA